jgi:hypothetical protein
MRSALARQAAERTYAQRLQDLQSQADDAWQHYESALFDAGCVPVSAPQISDSFVVFGSKVSFPYQHQIWIESTDGTIYHPQDAATLLSAVSDIKFKSAKIRTLIIKDHG